MDALDPDDPAALDGLRKWNTERSGYAQIMSTRPQTIAYALDDSPAGLLAWSLEWFDDYGEHPEAICAAAILANVTLYWLTGTGGSSGNMYMEAASSWDRTVPRSEVPTAVAVFPGTRLCGDSPNATITWSAGIASTGEGTSPPSRHPTCSSATWENSSTEHKPRNGPNAVRSNGVCRPR